MFWHQLVKHNSLLDLRHAWCSPPHLLRARGSFRRLVSSEAIISAPTFIQTRVLISITSCPMLACDGVFDRLLSFIILVDWVSSNPNMVSVDCIIRLLLSCHSSKGLIQNLLSAYNYCFGRAYVNTYRLEIESVYKQVLCFWMTISQDLIDLSTWERQSYLVVRHYAKGESDPSPFYVHH